MGGRQRTRVVLRATGSSIEAMEYQKLLRDTEGHMIIGEGSDIEWSTPDGEVYRGRVLKIESEKAVVNCTDGKQRICNIYDPTPRRMP